jgi:hypothetical protein
VALVEGPGATVGGDDGQPRPRVRPRDRPLGVLQKPGRHAAAPGDAGDVDLFELGAVDDDEADDLVVDPRDRGGRQPSRHPLPEVGELPTPEQRGRDVATVDLVPTLVPDGGDLPDLVVRRWSERESALRCLCNRHNRHWQLHGNDEGVTGQVDFDSYENTGVRVAVELVDSLATEHAFGRPRERPPALGDVEPIFSGDPTWPKARAKDLPGLVLLARELRGVFTDLASGGIDGAAERLNALLAEHPALPHLSKDEGTWHLHHHPADVGLIPMASAICAEGLARTIGTGESSRLGVCAASGCERVYLDRSKNGSRDYCSTRCQNRTKAAAFRMRHATDARS